MSAHSSASNTARSPTDRAAVSRTIRVARHFESAPHSNAARVCGMSCTSALATDKYRLLRAGESRRANPTSLATAAPAGRPAPRRRPDQRGAVRPTPRPRAPDPARRPTSPAPTHRSAPPRQPHRHQDPPPPIPPDRTYDRHYPRGPTSRGPRSHSTPPSPSSASVRALHCARARGAISQGCSRTRRGWGRCDPPRPCPVTTARSYRRRRV